MENPALIQNIPEFNGPGVYALVDQLGKKYIGSSIHIRQRIMEHLHSFRKIKRTGKSKFGKDYVSNYDLKSAIQSGAVFSAVIIEKLKSGGNIYDLLDLERYYLEREGGIEKTYNIFPPTINKEKDFFLAMHLGKHEE